MPAFQVSAFLSATQTAKYSVLKQGIIACLFISHQVCGVSIVPLTMVEGFNFQSVFYLQDVIMNYIRLERSW